MIMDWMRSCYSTNAYFVADHSRVSPIKWYFCPPGAQLFPGRHTFGSRRWDDEAQKLLPVGVGEIPNPRPPYSKGATYAEAFGLGFCGTVPQFSNGVTLLSSPRSEFPDGFPTCCSLVLQQGGMSVVNPLPCLVPVLDPCVGGAMPCIMWGQLSAFTFGFCFPGLNGNPFLMRFQFNVLVGDSGWLAELLAGGFSHWFFLTASGGSGWTIYWWTTDPSGPPTPTSSGSITIACSPESFSSTLFNPSGPCSMALRVTREPANVLPRPPACTACPTTDFSGLNLNVVATLTNGSCPSCNNLNFGVTFDQVGNCSWRSPFSGSIPGIYVCGTNPIYATVDITAGGGGNIVITASLVDSTSGLPIVTFQGTKPDCSSTVSFSLAYVSDDGECSGWAGASMSVTW